MIDSSRVVRLFYKSLFFENDFVKVRERERERERERRNYQIIHSNFNVYIVFV